MKSCIGVCFALVVVNIARAADEVNLRTVPAVVVKTFPQAGTDGVDPGTKEIRVTFSKDMRDGSWSWAQISDDSFPEIVGRPRYLPDKRTCVVQVKLKPATTYAIWLNSERFGNFKDSGGKSSVPYLLVFKTK